MGYIMKDRVAYGGGGSGDDPTIYLTKQQYDALNPPATDQLYGITDWDSGESIIDDTTPSESKVWSSSKTSTEISAEVGEVSTSLSNKTKITTFEVGTTSWTEDTTSQSGTTLYKKQISLNNVYVTSPSVDIGAASGSVLPTVAQQTAYNLVQYVTVDDTVPCLYLYASAEPESAFYINVEGCD